MGMSSREPSSSSVLVWDDVSGGGVVTSDFWGGDVVTAAVVDCSDPQLDASATAQSRRLVTTVVMLPSGLGGNLGGSVVRMMEALPMGRTLVSDSPCREC